MTHWEAMRAWGRSMRDWASLLLALAGLLPFVGLPGSTNLWQAVQADPRWCVLFLAILGISYRAAYKTINADRQRCASDALQSDHELRTAVALLELRTIYRYGLALQERAKTTGATPPSQPELRAWDAKVRRSLHERWVAGMEQNYIDQASIQSAHVPIYGQQLEWALHHVKLLVESDGYSVR